jgi:uncharacterized protein (UPF0276 family)
VELAINHSPQAAELLAHGAIRLDRFKCPDWPDMIARASAQASVYVHFPLEAGPRQPREVNLDTIAAMIEQTHTPQVNTHLVAFADDAQTPRQIEDQMLRHLSSLADRFGAERIIAENIPYHADKRVPKQYAPACVDPELISRVIERIGCGLLLDISHARISADSLGVDAHEYIERLPVARLRELHVTGMQRIDGVLIDHMGLARDDWPHVESAIERIGRGAWGRPWCLAFEYGGIGEPFRWRSQASVIASDLPRLDRLICDLRPGPRPV